MLLFNEVPLYAAIATVIVVDYASYANAFNQARQLYLKVRALSPIALAEDEVDTVIWLTGPLILYFISCILSITTLLLPRFLPLFYIAFWLAFAVRMIEDVLIRFEVNKVLESEEYDRYEEDGNAENRVSGESEETPEQEERREAALARSHTPSPSRLARRREESPTLHTFAPGSNKNRRRATNLITPYRHYRPEEADAEHAAVLTV
jgi:hypothetical protein